MSRLAHTTLRESRALPPPSRPLLIELCEPFLVEGSSARAAEAQYVIERLAQLWLAAHKLHKLLLVDLAVAIRVSGREERSQPRVDKRCPRRGDGIVLGMLHAAGRGRWPHRGAVGKPLATLGMRTLATLGMTLATVEGDRLSEFVN